MGIVLKHAKFQPFKIKLNIKIKICELSLKLHLFDVTPDTRAIIY